MHAVDDDGWTALHHAAEVGAEKCVRRLLRAGAKDSPAKDGQTALALARNYGHDTLASVLEKAAKR